MKRYTLISIFAVIFLMSILQSTAQSTCDYKVEIIIDGNEFETEDFKWRMKATKIEGKSTNITGTAEIQANGKTVKNYKPWTSDSISKQKTSNEYSPNLKPDEYKITAEINVECDDTNKENNIDVKTIKIKDEKEEKTTKKINSDDKEETSDKSRMKNTEIVNNELTNQQTETKTAQKTTTKKLISNEETENIVQLKNKNIQNPQLTTSAVQEPQIVYESSNEKAKGWIMIFLLTLSILLNIILIWKR